MPQISYLFKHAITDLWKQDGNITRTYYLPIYPFKGKVNVANMHADTVVLFFYTASLTGFYVVFAFYLVLNSICTANLHVAAAANTSECNKMWKITHRLYKRVKGFANG